MALFFRVSFRKEGVFEDLEYRNEVCKPSMLDRCTRDAELMMPEAVFVYPPLCFFCGNFPFVIL